MMLGRVLGNYIVVSGSKPFAVSQGSVVTRTNKRLTGKFRTEQKKRQEKAGSRTKRLDEPGNE